MEEARAADGESYGSLSDTLPEAPPLGPRGTWASEYPMASLAGSAIWDFAFAACMLGLGPRSRFGTVGFFVLVLVLPFGSLAVKSAVRRYAAGRAARRRAEFPLEPWRYDHTWDEGGERRTWLTRLAASSAIVGRRAWPRVLGKIAFIVAVALMASGFRTAALVVGGVLATWVSWVVWRLHGAGDAHLHFAKFPFHPGERVTLRFGVGSGGADFLRAEFRLCHVYEPAGYGTPIEAGIRRPVASESRPPGELPGSDFDIELSFDLPPDARGTRLTGGSPHYWVLDVLAATSSGPYAETFLIPIYDRPGATPAGEASAS